MPTCTTCNNELKPHETEAGVCKPCAEHARTAADKIAHNHFVWQLHLLTPRSFVTPTLIGINVAVFLAMVLSGASFTNPSIPTLLKWGATYGPFTLNGGWWRLLTSMFEHAGIVHIALNMWVLWSLGFAAERLFGNWRYLGVYLACGLGGGIASLWWHPMVVGVGASGAIFGLGGALLGALYFRKNKLPLPPTVISGQVRSLLLFIGYNVFFGLRESGIDNAAHIGGLLTGIALGAFLPVTLPNLETDAASSLATQRCLTLAPRSLAPGWVYKDSFLARYAPIFAAFIVLAGAAAFVSRHSGIVEMRQADHLIATHRTAAAAAKLQQAIAKDPNSVFSHYMLGGVYLDLQQYENAMAEFSKVVKLAPKSPGGYDGLGRAQLALDQPDLAIANFSKAAELDSKDPDIPMRLGMAYLLNDQPDKAIGALKNSISLRPSAQAYYDLGHAYDMKGDREAAFAAVKKSAEIDPSFEPAQRALSGLQRPTGKRQKASPK